MWSVFLTLVVLVVAVQQQQYAAVMALQLGPLLSSCVDACERGCNEIRSVQEKRVESGGDNTHLKVELKEGDDPRSALTEADKAAQIAIIGSLRSEWGEDLNIVGEEDEDDAKIEGDFDPLRKDIFEDDLPESAELDMSQVTLFVDPLDGTREFVEGRIESCQVLVGIAIDGEAVAGVVGLPFPKGDLSTDSTIIYGVSEMGSGVRGEALARGPFPLDRNIDGIKFPRPHHATGDSTAKIMDACRAVTIKKFGGSNVIYGGAGNKILATALGEVSCAFQHKIGGPWDLCAPEAILKSMGGRMTNLFGEDISTIYRTDAPPRCNERGWMATGPGSVVDLDILAAVINSLDEVKEYRKEVETEELVE